MRNKILPGLAKHCKKITVEHAKLGKNIVAEAVNGSKIIIDKSIPKDSDLYKRAVAHETHHAKEMRDGRISYGDNFVKDGDQVFPRKNGKIKYNGAWHKEGDKRLPWERRAVKAEKDV